MPQTPLGVPSVRFGLPQKVRLELPLGHCMTASFLIMLPLRQTCQGQVSQANGQCTTFSSARRHVKYSETTDPTPPTPARGDSGSGRLVELRLRSRLKIANRGPGTRPT